MKPCPFQVGDQVRYTPTARGQAQEAMTPPAQKLVAGKAYRVESIQKGAYIIVEGHRHAGGGLYWTEFTKDEATPSA